MEHLWRQSSRVGLLMGRMNADLYMCSVLEWGTWSWYLCPLELHFFGCNRIYINKSINDFVRHADLVWSSPWLQFFPTGVEPPWQRHLKKSGAEVMKNVAGWVSLHHLQCGFQRLLIGVPHHWCVLVTQGPCTCSSMSGQQLGIPSVPCVSRHSLCWLL